MNDFNEPGSLAPTGLYLGGTKYMVIQGEPGAVIRGKKVIDFESCLAMIMIFISFTHLLTFQKNIHNAYRWVWQLYLQVQFETSNCLNAENSTYLQNV